MRQGEKRKGPFVEAFIPRASLLSHEWTSPCCLVPYDERICAARCLNWPTVRFRPALRSVNSRVACVVIGNHWHAWWCRHTDTARSVGRDETNITAKSFRRRAQTVSIGFKSPLPGGNRTDVRPAFRYLEGLSRKRSLSCQILERGGGFVSTASMAALSLGF